MTKFDFDIIVVGAGHAGCEAALASSRMGLKTAMITTNTKHIAYMSCNPAVGGLAKGNIVREIDSLGGEMAVNTDKATIQFRRLNTKKGPAVRASRSQCDKQLYSDYMTEVIVNTPGLKLLEAEVKRLHMVNGRCEGVELQDQSVITSRATVITTGTFMNGIMHVGFDQKAGGRAGDRPSIGLSDHLKELGLAVTRLKTGTPARLHKDSIDWSKTTPQPGDERFYAFSRKTKGLNLPQVNCYISYTNEKTHEIIRSNLDKSPMYCGIIEGIGPRYCPSIEDKIVRFADKDRHQTFLEPEGLNTDLIYVQGMSTSLPADIQQKFLETIAGLENVKIVRPGYAVEYDFVHPTQLNPTLEVKSVEGLYLAGQVNGTSGYEEAAGQGFWAGVNAALKILDKDPMILRRDQSYLGVLVDDLVTKGTEEPYRMFTSRAEHRLVLREDNTDERLIEEGRRIGLISDEEMQQYQSRQEEIARVKNVLKASVLVPNKEGLEKLERIKSAPIVKPTTLEEILRRSEVGFEAICDFSEELLSVESEIAEKIEIDVKYNGYIARQNELIEQSKRLDLFKIPEGFDYKAVIGFSTEEKEKLQKIQPKTVGQASRISGVNPSAVQALIMNLKGRQKVKEMSV